MLELVLITSFQVIRLLSSKTQLPLAFANYLTCQLLDAVQINGHQLYSTQREQRKTSVNCSLHFV